MDTIVLRIRLADVTDLAENIKNKCIDASVDDYHLVSTVLYQTELLLIFQK